ncbi:MAG: hypothetical protein GY822_11285 [Deltaproteobacteria bacterium]|nr:hypothetical protein [Deltaproteobacteria bacterium]
MAWDGYIEGENLEIDTPQRIVQAWRPSEFPEDPPFSKLKITLSPDDNGTLLTFKHSNLPAGQGVNYESGWVNHYLSPMQNFFKSFDAG